MSTKNATSDGHSDERLQRKTPSRAASRIAARTRADVIEAVDRESIDHTLHELDREWDVERVLFAISGIIMLAGVTLTRSVNRRWLTLPALVAGFQVQHAIQGWCPPFAVLRRLGVRTRREIDDERTALKAARGDFRGTRNEAERALDMAQV